MSTIDLSTGKTPTLAGVINAFVRLEEEQRRNNPDYPDCEFKTGDRVILTQDYFSRFPHLSSFCGDEFIITSISKEDDNLFEMTLNSFFLMVYNTDIQLVYKPCKWCASQISEGINCSHCGGPQG